jgi:serine/threonine-protein kinase HipA
LAAAHHFLLSHEEATEIARRQVATIAEHWDAVCEEAAISKTDRKLLATRQFLNPFSVAGMGMDEVRLN